MRSHVDLDLFGILGVTGGKGRTTLGANALVFRQLVWIIDDWQVAVISPTRTGPILPLAPLGRRSGVPIVILAFKVIRAILGRRFLALATEELILELSVLTPKMFNLGFEVLSPMHGPSVLSFPIADLLPQFGVLTPQFGNFLAQLKNFATKLPHQLEQISRRGRRIRVDQGVFHDADVCNPDLPCVKRPIASVETGWAKLYGRPMTNPNGASC
jgi:hypothetical protein